MTAGYLDGAVAVSPAEQGRVALWQKPNTTAFCVRPHPIRLCSCHQSALGMCLENVLSRFELEPCSV